MSINLCDTCGEVNLVACQDTIVIDANMTPSTSYTVWLTDHHGNNYTSSVTSGVDGSLTIDTTGFVEGLFSPNHGKLELTVSTSATEETFETITYNSGSYSCLILSFKNVVS